MGPTDEGVGISALSTIATLQLRVAGAITYTITEQYWDERCSREAAVANVATRHNALLSTRILVLE